MPTELSSTNQTFSTDEREQGDLLHDYVRKFANLPIHLQVTKLCSNAGLAKTVEKGQYFTTLDDTELDRLKGSCREYTLLRSDKSSQVKGWIRGNTKIGAVLHVAVSYHQERYGVEIRINSFWRWNLFMCEDRERDKQVRKGDVGRDSHGASTEKPVAKARPTQTPSSMLSSTMIPVPYHERKWIDAEPGRFDKVVWKYHY